MESLQAADLKVRKIKCPVPGEGYTYRASGQVEGFEQQGVILECADLATLFKRLALDFAINNGSSKLSWTISVYNYAEERKEAPYCQAQVGGMECARHDPR